MWLNTKDITYIADIIYIQPSDDKKEIVSYKNISDK